MKYKGLSTVIAVLFVVSIMLSLIGVTPLNWLLSIVGWALLIFKIGRTASLFKRKES